MSQYLDSIAPSPPCGGSMTDRPGLPPKGLNSAPQVSGGSLAMTVASIVSIFFNAGDEGARPNPIFPNQPPSAPGAPIQDPSIIVPPPDPTVPEIKDPPPGRSEPGLIPSCTLM